MRYQPAQYVAVSGQQDFDVPFPFLNNIHVEVLVNGTVTPVLEWVGPARLRLAFPLLSGDSVVIRRNTPIDQQLVKFNDGSVLTQEDLNLSAQQLLYKQQELSALYDGSLAAAQSRLATKLGIVTNPEHVAQQLAELVLEQEVLATFKQRITDIDLNSEKITAQAFNHDQLKLTVDDVEAKRAALRTDHTALVGRVDAVVADVGGVKTSVTNEQTARVDGDNALASTLTLVGAKTADGLAFVFNLNTAKVTPDESLGQRLDALTAKADGNESRIITEETARASGDGALSNTISLIGAKSADGLAFIINTDTAKVSSTETLGQRLNSIDSRAGNIEASVTTEQTARVNGDNALASDLSLIGAKSADSTAFVLNLTTAKVSSTETLGQRLDAITAKDGSLETMIKSEETARINGDNALSSTISLIGAKNATNDAFIINLTTAKVSATESLAQKFDALVAKDNDNAAKITSEETARINADGVFTQQFTLLGSKSTDGTAWVLNLNTTKVDATTSLGTRLSGIDTRIGNAEASVVNEQTARTDGDNALASDISSLTTTVDGHTASISTHASSIDGLKVRHGVKLNANGYITGFVQNNDGKTGSFVIVADTFAIVDPAAAPGGTGTVPFEVSGGITRIKEAMIGSLQVDKVTSGSLGANVTQNGDWTLGTGKIIWDNGTYMKVAGLGFGSTNQFLEWFGPKMALNLCTEANAIQYLKTDGSAYFGGALSAGTLTNKASTSLTSATAEVAVGPFGSNGNPKQVALSYTYSSSQKNTSTCPSPLPEPAATIVLYKGAAGDTANPVATLNVAGTAACADGFGATEPGSFTQDMSGSVTWTDNSTALSGYEFWAKITSRTTGSVGEEPIIITQRVTIISTEQ